MCAVYRCRRRQGEVWICKFKTGPEVTIGSMAVYRKSESHGAQTEWCGLVRASEVPEGLVYFEL